MIEGLNTHLKYLHERGENKSIIEISNNEIKPQQTHLKKNTSINALFITYKDF